MTLTKIPPFDRNENNLQLPDLPEEYLNITIIDNDEDISDINEPYPLAVSDVKSEKILDAKKLTKGENVKEIYAVELSTSISSYQPGDTIGIVTRNRNEDVDKLFNHLGISHLCAKKCKISQKTSTDKKNIILPFLDKITTLEYIFTNYLDIQSVPKKLLIRILVDFTKNEEEKKHLQRLCSKVGDDYAKEILELNKSFLDLLLMFPTCCPPVARLIENLPRLLPRPYSIASSPLVSPGGVRIVFSVVRTKDNLKEGLCSGMLKSLIDSNKGEVKMFFRKCNGFNLPEENVPLIFIGPGTGIAPFIGFLEHIKAQQKKQKVWMFYGCRHKENDYLFKEELKEYLDVGVLTKLFVAFSRDGEEIKYVQDNIKKFGKELCELVCEENAIIYVCGDAKNMRKDVQNAFAEIFQTHKEMTNKEAVDYIRKLQKDKRYRQDIWF